MNKADLVAFLVMGLVALLGVGFFRFLKWAWKRICRQTREMFFGPKVTVHTGFDHGEDGFTTITTVRKRKGKPTEVVSVKRLPHKQYLEIYGR